MTLSARASALSRPLRRPGLNMVAMLPTGYRYEDQWDGHALYLDGVAPYPCRLRLPVAHPRRWMASCCTGAYVTAYLISG